MKKKILVLCGLAAIALLFFCLQPQPVTDGDMSLHAIDVGQGDCLLLESEGRFGLIDSGNSENTAEIISYLKKMGVTRLDFAIATHPHADHIGGMPGVLKEFGADLFAMSDAKNPTNSFEAMLDAAAQYCTDTELLYTGDTLMLGSAHISVLSPEKGYIDDNLNNHSLVLQVASGGCTILLTGDSEADIEQTYAPKVTSCDLLKIGHHGSRTSTSKLLLAAAQPKLALISCGASNSYGHPHDSIVESLSDSHIYRTDQNGTVVFTAKEGVLYAKSER